MKMFFKKVKTKFEQRRRYKFAVRELSALSDRELQDLGIPRGAIKSVAMGVYHK